MTEEAFQDGGPLPLLLLALTFATRPIDAVSFFGLDHAFHIAVGAAITALQFRRSAEIPMQPLA
jgi:hypothetical protein